MAGPSPRQVFEAHSNALRPAEPHEFREPVDGVLPRYVVHGVTAEPHMDSHEASACLGNPTARTRKQAPGVLSSFRVLIA